MLAVSLSSKEILSKEYLTQFKCPHMKETLQAQELLPCVKWNYDGAKNGGVVPMEPIEDDIPKGEWGWSAQSRASKAACGQSTVFSGEQPERPCLVPRQVKTMSTT